MRLRHAWVMGMAWLACGALADDGIYRWKDAAGQVHYGSQPPPGVKAEPLGERGALSVLPAFEPPPPPPPEPVADRVERLERELAAERRAREEAFEREQAERELAARRKADCEARHRSPCDERGEPLEIRPIIVRPPRHVPERPFQPRPPHRPHPPLRPQLPPPEEGRPPHRRPPAAQAPQPRPDMQRPQPLPAPERPERPRVLVPPERGR